MHTQEGGYGVAGVGREVGEGTGMEEGRGWG